ncbi:lasso peptide [Scytonema sp. PRP1]|uniref:lasso peptide n=1 Tax=Scytonema sp. PRP1 TaxID=3120513 RepID=UPI002FD09B13
MTREHYHNQQVVTVDRQLGVQLMKKTYNAPKLTNHGSVEAITQLFGPGSRKDFLIFTGNPNGVAPGTVVSGTTGSTDADIVPQGSYTPK